MPNYNVSYFLLSLAWLEVILAGPRRKLAAAGVGDNVNPRAVMAQLGSSDRFTPEQVARLQRRAAAHANGMESIPMMAAAVVRRWHARHAYLLQVAGNTAGLGATYMNVVTACYLVFRIAFTQLYIRTTTQGASWWRTAAWILATCLS